MSLLEIYNEQVRDLLGKGDKSSTNMRVREAAGKGFYVDGLRSVPVDSYEAIAAQIDEVCRSPFAAAALFPLSSLTPAPASNLTPRAPATAPSPPPT